MPGIPASVTYATRAPPAMSVDELRRLARVRCARARARNRRPAGIPNAEQQRTRARACPRRRSRRRRATPRPRAARGRRGCRSACRRDTTRAVAAHVRRRSALHLDDVAELAASSARTRPRGASIAKYERHTKRETRPGAQRRRCAARSRRDRRTRRRSGTACRRCAPAGTGRSTSTPSRCSRPSRPRARTLRVTATSAAASTSSPRTSQGMSRRRSHVEADLEHVAVVRPRSPCPRRAACRRSRALDHEPISSSSSQSMTSARMNPRCRSEWITPAHSGALAPARNVHARDSLSPVVRNVRRPSRWYAACATVCERRLAEAVHLAHLGAVVGRARGDLGLDVDRHRDRAGDRRVASVVDFSPVFSTTSSRLGREQEHGRELARSSALEVGAVSGVPSESTACARSSAATSAAISLSPLFAARRWRSSRCSTLVEVGHHELELERVEVAFGVGLDTAVVERAQHDRGSRRSCAARRAPWRRDLRRASRRAAARGARARSRRARPSSTSTSPRARSSRSSGTVAMPTAASYSLGAGSPVSALNRRLAPAPVKPTSPRFSIGAQATDRASVASR